jgi:pimeloyl-ACP methyl ester carboxylesterase
MRGSYLLAQEQGSSRTAVTHSQGETTMAQISSSDGTMIGFQCSGTGPPLLLVHGTTADHQRWGPIIPPLAQQFTVYTMDRRGRGASSDAPVYHLLREAADVAAVVAAIGEPLFLLGHSYGALCSLEAARLTDGVSRLILYEPPPPTGLPLDPVDIPDRMQALIDSGAWEVALEVFMREVVRMPAHELATYRQLPMWKVRVQLVPTIPRELTFGRTYRFQAEQFADLRVPTLLLLGGDSPPMFQQAIAQVEAALPDSRVVVLPGQRHIAMDTNPTLFVHEVLHFLGAER